MHAPIWIDIHVSIDYIKKLHKFCSMVDSMKVEKTHSQFGELRVAGNLNSTENFFIFLTFDYKTLCS